MILDGADIPLPEANARAVYSRMVAERQRDAKRYRSEGEEEADKIRAKADREKAALLAEARRKAAVRRGMGRLPGGISVVGHRYGDLQQTPL